METKKSIISLGILVTILALVGILMSFEGWVGYGQNQKPELHPQSLILDPSSPVKRGIKVEVSSTIVNTGDEAASEFQVEFSYRKEDREKWIIFATDTMPGLDKDEQVEVQKALETSELEPGTYRIRVVVDPGNLIPEMDETNNEITASLTIHPSKLMNPELHPLNITFDPLSPVEWNKDVDVSLGVVNTGGSAADEFNMEFFYRKRGEKQWGSPFATGSLDRLGVDEQGTVTGKLEKDRISTPGTYEIRVVVDAGNVIPEQDETNNEMIALLRVQGSEILPKSITFTPPSLVRQGETVIVSTDVVNIGEVDAGSFEVAFFINGVRFDIFRVPSLGIYKEDEDKPKVTAQGKLDTSEPEIVPGPETYKIRVVVDFHDQIPENDETNNEITASLTILPPEPRKPELHSLNIVLNPPSPITQGEPVEVSSLISNTGNKEADELQVEFLYRQRGIPRWVSFDTNTIPSLGIGETKEVRGKLDTFSLSPGIYEIKVIVDSPVDLPDPNDQGQIDEQDETNNEIITSLTILAERMPDLYFKWIRINPSTVSQGEKVEICAEVGNKGDGSAGQFQVKFSYRRVNPTGSSIPFTPITIPGLTPSEQTEVCITLDTTNLDLGTYEIKAVVDPDNWIAEQDEVNNIITGYLTILPIPPKRPDLYPKYITFTPPSPVQQGVTVEVCTEVGNKGDEPANKFLVQFTYYRRVDPYIFATIPVPGLNVGEQEKVCAPLKTFDLPSGTYEITVTVDPPDPGWVEEQDETNNVISKPLTIGPIPRKPDLYLKPISFDPPSPVKLGEIVKVCTEAGNKGATPADSFKMKFSYRVGATYNDFVPFATSIIPGLNVGKQVPACGLLDTTPLGYGTHEIMAEVDPDNWIAEQDETNNKITAFLTIRKVPSPPPWPLLSTNGPVRLLGIDERTKTAFAGSEDGNLYAIDLETNTEKWRFPISAPIKSLEIDTRAPRAIYVGSQDGNLYAIDLDTGEEKWMFTIGSPVVSLAIDKFGTICAGTAEGRAHAVSADGIEKWLFPPADQPPSGAIAALAVDGTKNIIYIGSADGNLYAVDKHGTLMWTASISSAIAALALDRFGNIYVGTEDSEIHKRSAINGDPVSGFPFHTGGPVGALAIDLERDTIYAGSDDYKLYALDLEGNLKWAFTTGGPVRSTPAIYKRTGAIFVGSDDHSLYAIDLDGTLIYKVSTDGPARSIPVIYERREDGAKVTIVATVYFGSDDHNIYGIELELVDGTLRPRRPDGG